MKPETIKVTINPDGTARAYPEYPDKCTCSNALEYENCVKNCGHGKEEEYGTFEIEFEECTCIGNEVLRKIGYQQLCDKICTWVELEPGTIYTAEILPNNKVKILT